MQMLRQQPNRHLLPMNDVEEHEHLVLVAINDRHPGGRVADPMLERRLEMFDAANQVEGVRALAVEEACERASHEGPDVSRPVGILHDLLRDRSWERPLPPPLV